MRGTRRIGRSLARAATAFLLRRHTGMYQWGIGGSLAMGRGSVECQQLQRLRERMKTDSDLCSTVERAQGGLKPPAAATQDEQHLNS
jgi:hypothetical protein